MDQAAPATRPWLAARWRNSFVGFLSGFLAGLITAAIARLLMRVVAVAATGQGHFSLGGTANIFMFAALIGPLLGLAYYTLRPRLPGNTVVKGLSFAVFLLVVFQVPILFIVPEFRDEIMVIGPLGFGVFGLINLSYSLILAAITARIDANWRRTAQGANWRRLPGRSFWARWLWAGSWCCCTSLAGG